MSPELIHAIKERHQAGQSREAIKEAVLAMGHTDVVFDAAYTLAQHDLEHAPTQGATLADTALPSAYRLLMQALGYTRQRLDLVLCALVPGLLFFGLSTVGERFADAPYAVAIHIATVVAFMVYLGALFLVMYVASHPELPISYTGGLQWVRQHLLHVLWVSILLTLIILGGFMLFVIPGVIFLVTLYFAQYALFLENQTGTSALARSSALVKGRFWPVALKLLAFMFYILLPIVVVFAFFGALLALVLPEAAITLAGEFAAEFVSAIFTVVSAHAMGQLYRSLSAGRPLTPVAKTKRVLYGVFAFLGAGVIAVAILLTIFFQSFLEDTILKDASTLQLEIQSTTLSAKLYALEHAGSYEGVCDTLQAKVSSAEPLTCHDSAEQWAIQGEYGDERWCADTTTMGKQVQSSLGERLTCLPLPEKQPVDSPLVPTIDTEQSSTSQDTVQKS